MRFNATPEEERLEQIVSPYLRVFHKPLRMCLDENAPAEVREAYAKLNKLTAEHIDACQEP